MKIFKSFVLALSFLCASMAHAHELILKDNLDRARPGDYVVTARSKMVTLLVVREKNGDSLTFEEITAHDHNIPKHLSWEEWLLAGAPGHANWIMYEVDVSTGLVKNTFSFTRNEWVSIPQAQNILTTLLNLRLQFIPETERKRVGPARTAKDRRPIWQPRMVVNGETISGVLFDAWKTRWPKDGSELAGKMIEVYLPMESDRYPSYFPYWLQISGMIGKAQIRIIDSGTGFLRS